MTPSTSPADAQLLLLDKHQVDALLSPDDVLQAVREAFVLHSDREGRVFPVVREPLATGGVFGIKSGDVQAQGLLGFKAAGFWPANRQRGGEPHQATILLIDPATGRPLCVIDGNAITTVRTGAAGGLGLQQLARPDSTRLCIFGTGVQARIQLDFALRLLPSLREVLYVSADGQRNTAFEDNFTARCSIAPAADRNAAVAQSDIVITATPGGGALFDLDAVQPGTHLNCVGADTRGKRELPEGLLARVRLVVDDRTQAQQIGETQWAPDTASTELGDLLSGKTSSSARRRHHRLRHDRPRAAGPDRRAPAARARAATGTGTRLAWPW
jgi:alanine dehydrogenase